MQIVASYISVLVSDITLSPNRDSHMLPCFKVTFFGSNVHVVRQPLHFYLFSKVQHLSLYHLLHHHVFQATFLCSKLQPISFPIFFPFFCLILYDV